MSIEPADERILRAKYLDWCSARLADRFLALTPDQIYDLAHESLRRDSAPNAARASVPADEARPKAPGAAGAGVAPLSVSAPDAAGVGAVGAARGGVDGGESYRELVARVTEVLAARVGLPSYDAWLTAYKKSPEQFEAELLGLWRKRA